MENYREIVEKHIGRKLKSNEHIHHKDGDSHNNKIENLEILSPKEHAPKRIKILDNGKEECVKFVQRETDMRAEDLNKAFNIFFPLRQKQLIFRRLNKMPFSKTEIEYYSRVIKKKLVGLANMTLHKIAQMLMYG